MYYLYKCNNVENILKAEKETKFIFQTLAVCSVYEKLFGVAVRSFYGAEKLEPSSWICSMLVYRYREACTALLYAAQYLLQNEIVLCFCCKQVLLSHFCFFFFLLHLQCEDSGVGRNLLHQIITGKQQYCHYVSFIDCLLGRQKTAKTYRTKHNMTSGALKGKKEQARSRVRDLRTVFF